MAEAEKTGRNTIKGKMGDRKEAENKTSSKSKWPLIKHKKNLQITRLKENDLFTLSFMRRNICIACMLLLYFDCFIRSKDQVFVPPVYFGISCYFFSGANKAKTKTDPNSQMDSSSEPLVGGETVFYGSRNSVLADVAPAEGMVLHIHGDKCTLLEAWNVTKGVKYIFHSDACFA
ncbi:hypothetical protein NC653_029912 [Populus alba x Populus x berolinensis]|uniref:Uncharacterized protein n=1 Tax=Populus alba x Populus x berolinensis TaxID=444605 RepID=A0AAD6Q5T0_9ROSI|nr:hypothetical protein NC653_029912 [Populus alba x Populus x berolinensis]